MRRVSAPIGTSDVPSALSHTRSMGDATEELRMGQQTEAPIRAVGGLIANEHSS